MTPEIIEADTGGLNSDLHEALNDHTDVFLPSNDHRFIKAHETLLVELKFVTLLLFSHPIPSYNGRILS